MQASFRHTLLYDGACPICLASVGKIQALDVKGTLEYLPFQDPSVSGRFPHLPRSALEASVHLVSPDGEIREGADALEGVARILPGTAWAGRLLGLPLVKPLARWVYRLVAGNRYRWRCRNHCGGTSGTPDGVR